MYQVLIRKNSTGEERLYSNDWDWDDASEFLWTEGNFACDCNRQLFFERAAGERGQHDLGNLRGCGDTEYAVPYAILPDGTKMLLDN